MSAATAQLGFDLGTAAPPPSWAPQAPGTWSNRLAPLSVQRAHLALAVAALPGVAEPALRERYAAGTSELERHLAYLTEKNADSPDEPMRWWGVQWDLTELQMEHFIELFAQQYACGAEYRQRSDRHMLHLGLYLEPLGSLILQRWPTSAPHLQYSLLRDLFFAEHFTDNCPRYEVSAQLWEEHYCGDVLCRELQRVPGVSVFEYLGQRYLIPGIHTHLNHCDCVAWRVIPKSQWSEATYTYQQLIQMWQNGALERGSKYGLVVNVHGQPHVCVDPAVFFDSNYVFTLKPFAPEPEANLTADLFGDTAGEEDTLPSEDGDDIDFAGEGEDTPIDNDGMGTDAHAGNSESEE